MSEQWCPLGLWGKLPQDSEHWVRDVHPSPFQSTTYLHTGLLPSTAGEDVRGWCPPVVVLPPSPPRTREAPWTGFLADHLLGVVGAQPSSAESDR